LCSQTFKCNHSTSLLLWNTRLCFVSHQFSTVSSSTHAELTPVLKVLGQPTPQSSSSSFSLSASSCTLRHTALSLHHQHTPLQSGSAIQRGENSQQYKLNQTTIFSLDHISSVAAIAYHLNPRIKSD